MKRMHVNLKTSDLSESVRFYTELFGAAPTKRKSDYAKWMLDDPHVNFSLSATEGDPGIEHLGIEAETEEELAGLRTGIARAESVVREASTYDEGDTTCCYAASDKTWIADPQGVAWEAFHTHGERETYYAEEEASACCADGDPSAACC